MQTRKKLLFFLSIHNCAMISISQVVNSYGWSCCLGYGQEKGGISCILYNRHPEKDLIVVVMETVPWFLRVYLHTLSIESFLSDDVAENGTTVKPSELIQKLPLVLISRLRSGLYRTSAVTLRHRGDDASDTGLI